MNGLSFEQFQLLLSRYVIIPARTSFTFIFKIGHQKPLPRLRRRQTHIGTAHNYVTIIKAAKNNTKPFTTIALRALFNFPIMIVITAVKLRTAPE